MKALKCEMCNSSDIVKDGDYFVCQACGTKYTVEAAKKLMIDGVVKIDNSKELENLYILARRAKTANDYDNAKKYYGLILEKEPSSWEAIFYDTYYHICKGTSTQVADNSVSMQRCLKITFDSIKELDVEDKKNATNEICKKLKALVDAYGTASRNSFDKSPKTYDIINALNKRITASADILFQFGDLMHENNKENIYSNQIVDAWKGGIALLFKNADIETNRKSFTEKIDKYSKKICLYQKDYVALNIDDLPENSVFEGEEQKRGCYVATAVYGSYDCPQVWTLRRFRDYTLAKTWYGRTFIHIYYTVSPTLVKLFGHKKWFTKLWKPKIDKLVKKLNGDGVDDSPYNDINW